MTTVPFDLYGDLEDAYDKAERIGDVEVVETLDVFRLWSERPRAGGDFLDFRVVCPRGFWPPST